MSYPMRSVGGVLISLTRTRRWINHSSQLRMASATPDVPLPSQSQDIAASRLVPNYTALYCLVTEAHVCEQLAHTAGS